MYKSPKHAQEHRTIGDIWHEEAESEGFIKPLLAFTACMGMVLALVVVVGGTQPVQKAHAEPERFHQDTLADRIDWKARDIVAHEKSKEQWANVKAQIDIFKEAQAQREAEEAALQAEEETYSYDYYELPVYYSYYVPSAWTSETGDLRSNGVEGDGSYIYTWYSQNVLPGDGLDIPGRHVGDGGYVMDGDGNVVVASSDLAKGTVVDTPYGQAKVYDTGCASGVLDVYTNW